MGSRVRVPSGPQKPRKFFRGFLYLRRLDLEILPKEIPQSEGILRVSISLFIGHLILLNTSEWVSTVLAYFLTAILITDGLNFSFGFPSYPHELSHPLSYMEKVIL